MLWKAFYTYVHHAFCVWMCINCNRLCQKIDYKSWIELNSFSWAQRMCVCEFICEKISICVQFWLWNIFWVVFGFMLTCFNSTHTHTHNSYTKNVGLKEWFSYAMWAQNKNEIHNMTQTKYLVITGCQQKKTEKYDDYWMLSVVVITQTRV